MKTLIISCVALLLIIIFVSFSALYINKTIEKMLGISDSLPITLDELTDDGKMTLKDALEKTEKIKQYWESRKFMVRLSVSQLETDHLDMAVVDLESALLSKDNGKYASALAILKFELHRLSESEKLSIEAIL